MDGADPELGADIPEVEDTAAARSATTTYNSRKLGDNHPQPPTSRQPNGEPENGAHVTLPVPVVVADLVAGLMVVAELAVAVLSSSGMFALFGSGWVGKVGGRSNSSRPTPNRAWRPSRGRPLGVAGELPQLKIGRPQRRLAMSAIPAFARCPPCCVFFARGWVGMHRLLAPPPTPSASPSGVGGGTPSRSWVRFRVRDSGSIEIARCLRRPSSA